MKVHEVEEYTPCRWWRQWPMQHWNNFYQCRKTNIVVRQLFAAQKVENKIGIILLFFTVHYKTMTTLVLHTGLLQFYESSIISCYSLQSKAYHMHSLTRSLGLKKKNTIPVAIKMIISIPIVAIKLITGVISSLRLLENFF